MYPAVPHFPKNVFSDMEENFFFFNQSISFHVIFLNRCKFPRTERQGMDTPGRRHTHGMGHSVLCPPFSQSMAGVRPVFHSYIFQIYSENSQAYASSAA